MAEALLSVAGLSKRFGDQTALSAVTLDVAAGEFVVVLGPSGCGKTTLLRSIAGFVRPDAGAIRIAGAEVTRLPPYRRPLNTVFQSYALFPHMTVAENVAYGPRRHGASRREAVRRAGEALDLVGLAGFGARLPHELSGGQQQRVALVRALVNEPKLLLLDEPLSALDLKLRRRVQLELKHLQARLGIAFVIVTHDQEEAMTMADRIVVMNAGRIEQAGPGPEIYRAPATRFVAGFIGEANLLRLVPRPDGRLDPEVGSRPVGRGRAGAGREALGVLRPEQVALGADAEGPGLSSARGVIEDVIHVGPHVLVNVRVNGTLLAARLGPATAAGLSPGHDVAVGYRPDDLHVVEDA